MRWKLLAAVAVILAITGLLLFTEQGRKYAVSLGSMTRGLTSTLGNFVASFVKAPSGQEFNFELDLNREAIYGQSFSFSDAEFKTSCQILSLKIDGKNWEVGDKVKLEMVGSGEISVGSDGKVSLKADASLIKFDSWKTNNVKIEMEMLPGSFSMNNAKSSLINITASGKASKQLEDIELKADFNQANLKLEGFRGSVNFEDRLRLTGTAANLEINGKKI
ncbi:MAG: hypothetical protein QXU74_02975 [Candidatus Aenigmatarchaeota archaeon]